MTDRFLKKFETLLLLTLLAYIIIVGFALVPDISWAQMVGRCVEAPGLPCESSSSSSSGSGGGGWWARPYVDPAIAEAERLEREKQRKIRRQNRSKFKGVSDRIKDHKNNLKSSLSRLDEYSAIVKSVTYEEVPAHWGNLFVPDNALADILMVRPVNPTITETQVASEQLAKVGALYHFIKNNVSSAEDVAFLANQAASIMVGTRSYVHITFTSSWQETRSKSNQYSSGNAFDDMKPDVNQLLGDIIGAQRRIKQSESERAALLNQAKKEIKELAIIKQQLSSEPSEQKRENLQAKSIELSASLTEKESKYFELKEKETLDTDLIKGAGKKLTRRVEWVKN